MDLRRLIRDTGCRLLRGDALTEITCVCCDSRSAEPGALFVCLPGRHTDGSVYAAQAAEAGQTDVVRRVKGGGAFVHNRDVVTQVFQHARQIRAHLAAAHNQDIQNSFTSEY